MAQVRARPASDGDGTAPSRVDLDSWYCFSAGAGGAKAARGRTPHVLFIPRPAPPPEFC